MYLKCHKRFKDGKEHRYWSIVESVRTRRGVMKRQLLYLGEINDAQHAQWCSALDVLDDSNGSFKQMSLFPEDRAPPPDVCNPVQIRLNQMTLHRPRQWGGCWLAMELATAPGLFVGKTGMWTACCVAATCGSGAGGATGSHLVSH